jgi:hypothetical protein
MRTTGATSRLSAIHAKENNDATARMMDKGLDAVQELPSDFGLSVPLVDATRAEISDTLAGL